MSPLRILHVVEASFAGVGRHVLDLAEGCVAAGDVVDIAYGTQRVEPAFADRVATVGARRVVPVDVGRAPGVGDLRAIAALRAVVRAHGPYDVVHGHASKGGFHARVVPGVGDAVRIYTPNAFVTQSPDLGRVGRRVYATVERVLARRTDGLVFVSPEEEAHASALGLHPRSSRVVPNGIALVDMPTRAQARRDLDLTDDGPVIGFVGRLDRQKGLDRLLDAFSLVPATSGAVLAVVGVGEDEAALREQAEQLGVADRVRWLGRRPGQAAMAAFDVLAVPSRYEGFPYVVLEGLWAGLPVVATPTSGAGQVLGDGRTGVVAEPDAPSLAAALTALVSDDAPRAERSALAREVVTLFSADAMVAATRRYYLDLLHG